MKRITYLTMALAMVLSTEMIAQKVARPNPKVVKTHIVNAPAEKVWKEIGSLDKLEEVIPQYLASSKLDGVPKIGVKRHCETPDGSGYYKEQIIEYDEEAMFYRYVMTEGTIPAKNVNNSARVIPLGKDQSMIVWTGYFEYIPNEQMSKQQFEGFMSQAFVDIMNGYAKKVE